MSVQGICAVAGAVLLLILFAASATQLMWPRKSYLENPVIFFAAAGLALIFLRWPWISWPALINVDESQLLAQAMRYLAHPVPWRDVDGTTSGPLNSMFLSVFLFLGAPVSYITSRLVLCGAIWISLVLVYRTLRLWGTRREAQFLLMPAIVLYGFAAGQDFNHYSSETVPMILLSAGLYLLAKEWKREHPSLWRFFLLGLLSGIMPFAKLQAAPLSLFFLGSGAMLALRRKNGTHSSLANWSLRKIGALMLGSAVVPSLILGNVAATGALEDFWKSYIVGSAGYADQMDSGRYKLSWMLFCGRSDFTLFELCTFAGIVLLLLPCKRIREMKLHREFVLPLAVISLYCLLTIACCILPGKIFYHYLNLLFPPLAILFGLSYLASDDSEEKCDKTESKSLPQLRRFLVPLVLLVLVYQAARMPVYYLQYKKFDEAGRPLRVSAVSREVLAATRPNDTISVWGWMPNYYVETGLMPATRDAICHRVISNGPLRDYFRQRHLRDLKQARPAVFIDAVADGAFMWDWSKADTHESFPELAAFIDDNYKLWTNVQLFGKGDPVRIYLSNERFNELRASSMTNSISNAKVP